MHARLTAFFMLLLLGLASLAHAEDDYLEPQDAFRFSARMVDASTVSVTYAIADGYYMYRERFKVTANGATAGAPAFPPGKVKFDETFNKNVETYRKSVTFTVPVQGAGPFTLTVSSQGCADAGLCYAPMDSVARLTIAGGAPAGAAGAALPGLGGAATGSTAGLGTRGNGSPIGLVGPGSGSSIGLKAPGASGPAVGLTAPGATASGIGLAGPGPSVPTAAPGQSAPAVGPAVQGSSAPAVGVTPSSAPATTAIAAAQADAAAAPADDEPGAIERSLAGGRLLAILPLFFALGLGLSFTPCVLPMVPILSAIIVGEGRDVRRPRAFALSVSYALGMALVYTALGVVAGLAGEGMAAALQNPWVLGAFAMLMVLLSGAMFGFYELQLPSALQTKLAGASERRSAGRMAGVFAMGAISALIVGPCVAAPLAGALVYISQTRDVAIGGAALFAMAMGMSVPLLLVGLSAGTLLPRAGRWMEDVKRAFGVLMLAMALWLASPVLPPVAQMLGWMVLALGCGVYLLRRDARMWPARALGLLFLVGGALQLVGLATGARDPWSPLAQLGIGKHAPVAFQRIKSPADLDRAIAAANGRTVMLDFYADWCVSCKEMEKLTFTDPKVRGRLDRLVLLQADVTANDADDKALLKRFGLFGPPGILFFGADRAEVPRTRVIGYQNAAKFLASLGRAAP
jgi:thiol:disulfide interchange protein DsbD